MKTISAKKHIQQLASLMVEWGIEDIVLCPGSRNAAIVHTLANVDVFRCHSVTDERSAAFVAIGMSDATGKPVGVCCTSGSAVLNMLPAVSEARYRHVPLLVISADRPKEWIGQMDGQTLEQPNCFGPQAKSYTIEEPKDELQEWYVNRQLNEALASLTFDGCQPVHINLHINEPLFEFVNIPLPRQRVVRWNRIGTLEPSDLAELSCARRIMLIIGQGYHRTVDQWSNDIVLSLGRKCVVLAEHLSNISHRGEVITHFDDILATCDLDETYLPDMVIYIGNHIVSKRVKNYLRKNSPSVMWHVTDGDSVIDLFQSVTKMIKMPVGRFLEKMCGADFVCESSYLTSWKNADSSMRMSTDNLLEWSDRKSVALMLASMPSNSTLVVANSSSVRHIQHFDLPEDVQVFCNRGVNGIEGSLSAAVGYAIASDKLTLCLIGDLSFFYDMNALWNGELPSNLRVLIVNNGGGSIFATLPGLERSEHKWPFVAASHNQTARGWVESTGAKYVCADSEEQFVGTALPILFGNSDKPVVVEVIASKCGD